jgi:two-component system phosphate regulon sensor histidine kinase PhoR
VKNSTIIRVIAFGALAIMGIIAIQTYWVINTWNVKEQEFHERINVALYNVAKEFEKIGNQLPDYDLIDRVSSNYYVVNVNDVINATNLQYFLRRELEAVGLTEDFEYGIYDCGTNQMVYGDYITYANPSDTTNLKRMEAFPISDKYPYYFGIRFPNRANHILSNMSVTLIFSFVLLITIAFFFYSSFVILRQKRLSEMQKDFINNMTHEFKTPISTIKISSEVFLNHPLVKQDQRLHQYAQIIRDQNLRLNNQVEKVLQLAKIERDNFRLQKESLRVNELLVDILQSVQLKINDLGGQLTWDLSASHDLVLADRLHLSNIIYNLLDNASKYCKETPQIHVSTQNEKKCLAIHIQDQGIGIPPEYQQRVFSKFYRVPTGNVHNVKGFGLGLYYIKSICDAHGWDIELESQPDEGTCITLRLPYQKTTEREGNPARLQTTQSP